MDDIDRFLEDCALTYSKDESPERIRAADKLIREQPAMADGHLAVAAALGDAARCEGLVDPATVNDPVGPRGWPPLLYLTYSRVVQGDAVAAARALMDAGADPDSHFMWGDQYRFTAITGAFGEGEQGPICQPAHPNGMSLVRLLLEQGANPNDGQGLYNRMFTGSAEPVRLLLEFGLPVDAMANWRVAPDGAMSDFQVLPFVMGWDIEHGNLERLEVLLDAGVDPDLCRKGSSSAWRRAAFHGQAGARRLLEEHGCQPEPLATHERFAQALLEGSLEKARALHGADASALPLAMDRFHLLHRALEAKDTGPLNFLLNLGVDPNSRESRGVPALHEAAGSGRVEAIRCLLTAGADPTIKDGAHGGTAFGWARHMGQTEALAILNAHGEDSSAPSRSD